MNRGCLKLVLILVSSSMRDLLSDANSVFSVNAMFQVGRLFYKKCPFLLTYFYILTSEALDHGENSEDELWADSGDESGDSGRCVLSTDLLPAYLDCFERRTRLLVCFA